jgi:two-component system, OmpR family, sensor kinase
MRGHLHRQSEFRRRLHAHGHGHGRRGNPPLHVRLFWWSGVAILVTGLVAGAVFRITGPFGHRFAVFIAAGITLWIASGLFARRLGRPLRDVARVARDIGEGRLDSRAKVKFRDPWEVRVLAESVNEMAGRIQQQLADERELIAAVSHEIRAPLSRLRVLSELLASRGADPATIAKLEREIVEIDSLVGDLLASSRLDFSTLTFHRLDARESAVEALDRAGARPELLDVSAADPTFDGDPTLVARALSNLLDNAQRHAGGTTALVVRHAAPDFLVFEVQDAGPGFGDELLPRAFEPFQKGAVERRGSTSLGLGLALVRRIAEAHGGTAWAENRPEGGAKVCLRIARRRPTA